MSPDSNQQNLWCGYMAWFERTSACPGTRQAPSSHTDCHAVHTPSSRVPAQASAATPGPVRSGQGLYDALVQDAKHQRLSRRPRRAPRRRGAAEEPVPLHAEHACAGAPLEGVEGTEDGLQVQRLVRLRRRRRRGREVGAAAAARRDRGHLLQDRGLRGLAVWREAAFRRRGAAAGAAVGGAGGDGAEEHMGQHEEHERDVVALGGAHGLEDGARVTCKRPC